MYFHFLDSGVIGGVRVEECEVNEKPKSYTASTNFPEGYTNRMVRKTKICFDIRSFAERKDTNSSFFKRNFICRISSLCYE